MCAAASSRYVDENNNKQEVREKRCYGYTDVSRREMGSLQWSTDRAPRFSLMGFAPHECGVRFLPTRSSVLDDHGSEALTAPSRSRLLEQILQKAMCVFLGLPELRSHRRRLLLLLCCLETQELQLRRWFVHVGRRPCLPMQRATLCVLPASRDRER